MKLSEQIEDDTSKGANTMIDSYMAGKMAEYTQSEIARTRGLRNWTHLFRSTRSQNSR